MKNCAFREGNFKAKRARQKEDYQSSHARTCEKICEKPPEAYRSC